MGRSPSWTYRTMDSASCPCRIRRTISRTSSSRRVRMMWYSSSCALSCSCVFDSFLFKALAVPESTYSKLSSCRDSRCTLVFRLLVPSWTPVPRYAGNLEVLICFQSAYPHFPPSARLARVVNPRTLRGKHSASARPRRADGDV